MASVPPPTNRSSRRRFDYLPDKKLPDPPRFEATPAETQEAQAPSHEEPGLVHGQDTETAKAQANEAGGKSSTTPATQSERRARKSKRDSAGDSTPQASQASAEGARVQADSEDGYTAINIRLRFEQSLEGKAKDCCEANGATIRELAMLARRKMELTDEDFSANPLWQGSLHNLPSASIETLRVKFWISNEMLARWSTKLDPLGLKSPGVLAFNAVQHAFNRSAREVIAALMKAQ